MMKFAGIIPLLFPVALLFVQGCKKSTLPLPVPQPGDASFPVPQPLVRGSAFVSAAFPGYLLNSEGSEVSPEAIRDFEINGKVEWKCLTKPVQSPPPTIESPNRMSTNVKDLKKGAYLFEVTYRTKSGTKSAQTRVFVVDDSLAPGSAVLPMQTWIRENQGVFPGSEYWVYEVRIQNRPDLFCYRSGKRLKVEIRDLLNDAWIEVKTNLSEQTIGERSNPYFDIDEENSLTITYDPNEKQDSTVTRLVSLKTDIRLSL